MLASSVAVCLIGSVFKWLICSDMSAVIEKKSEKNEKKVIKSLEGKKKSLHLHPLNETNGSLATSSCQDES